MPPVIRLLLSNFNTLEKVLEVSIVHFRFSDISLLKYNNDISAKAGFIEEKIFTNTSKNLSQRNRLANLASQFLTFLSTLDSDKYCKLSYITTSVTFSPASLNHFTNRSTSISTRFSNILISDSQITIHSISLSNTGTSTTIHKADIGTSSVQIQNNSTSTSDVDSFILKVDVYKY